MSWSGRLSRMTAATFAGVVQRDALDEHRCVTRRHLSWTARALRARRRSRASGSCPTGWSAASRAPPAAAAACRSASPVARRRATSVSRSSVAPATGTTHAHISSPSRSSGRPTTADPLDLGEGDDQLLDLPRRDVEPAADDDLLLAPDDGEVAVVVDRDQVAAAHPAVGAERGRGARRVGEEADAGVRAAGEQLALGAGVDDGAVVVAHLELDVAHGRRRRCRGAASGDRRRPVPGADEHLGRCRTAAAPARRARRPRRRAAGGTGAPPQPKKRSDDRSTPGRARRADQVLQERGRRQRVASSGARPTSAAAAAPSQRSCSTSGRPW